MDIEKLKLLVQEKKQELKDFDEKLGLLRRSL